MAGRRVHGPREVDGRLGAAASAGAWPRLVHRGLGIPGELVGADIDTRFFLGNHAPYGRLDVTTAPADADPAWLRDHADWTTVLDQQPLTRGGHNVFALRPVPGATHAA